MKENIPCKMCGKERMIDTSKWSRKRYLKRSPNCRKCATKKPALRNKISKGWFPKGIIPWSATHKMPPAWNKGLKGTHFSPRTEFKKDQKAWNKGLPHMQDEKHPKWAGDKVGYNALHTWISRKLGKPSVCQECGKNGLSGKKIHWANINKKYLRNKDDWRRLCVPCHKKYDLGLMRLSCVA